MAGSTRFRVPTMGPSFLSKSTCILNKVRRQSITFIPLSSPLVPYSSPCIACQHLNLKTLSTFLFLSQATATIVFYYIGYTSVQEAPRGGTILLYPNCARQALSFRHFGIGS